MSVERDLTEHEVRWLLTMPTWGLHEGQEIERKFRALAAELVRVEASERLIALAANERLAKLEQAEQDVRDREEEIEFEVARRTQAERERDERVPRLVFQRLIVALVLAQKSAGEPVGAESHDLEPWTQSAPSRKSEPS